MRVWRMSHPRWTDDAFSGEGSRRAGRRWNPKGWPVVYCADSLALAMLEVLVHLTEESRGIAYHAFPVDLPNDRIRTFPDPDLPADWRQEPIPASTQAIGEAWLREGATLALRVPSVVVPAETNVALNPHHPDFERITIGDPQRVGFDARIWQG